MDNRPIGVFDSGLGGLTGVKELAALLGISGAAVSKLVKRGMPTDSLERAKRWRKRHLEPGRIKGGKFDPNAPHLVAAATAEAERLASVVLQSLDGMGSAADGERILAPLRSALRVTSPDRSRGWDTAHRG